MTFVSFVRESCHEELLAIKTCIILLNCHVLISEVVEGIHN